jgi:DNA-binding winged helix-turn-helix (wHTH) protein
LQRIDRHPIGGLDGIDLADCEPQLINDLLSTGILVEVRPLDEIDGLLVQRFGEELVALSTTGDGLSVLIDPAALRRFEIDVDRLCASIRQSNRLSGPPLQRLSNRVILLGDYSETGLRRRVFLVRLLRDDNALETVFSLQPRADDARLTILTPTQRPLSPDLRRQIWSERAAVLAIPDVLAPEPGAPFSLRMPFTILAEEPGTATARLVIDTSGHIVTFDGNDVRLPLREFTVLMELARQTAGGGSIVRREMILDIITENSVRKDEEPNEEQINNCISRIRAALSKAARSNGQQPGRLIVTHKKVGYRLGLAPAEVLLR